MIRFSDIKSVVKNQKEYLKIILNNKILWQRIENKILGVSYDISNITISSMSRTDGLSTTQEVNQYYPYNSIRLCNLRPNGITYQGQTGFARDGSNGEVMVEIPKFYFRRYREGNVEHIQLSPTPKKGFIIDPSFVENGKLLDYVYIGAYEGAVVDGKLSSRTGVHVDAGKSLTEYRSLANANGLGFGEFDYRMYSMIQRLFMVYFADRNSQKVVGRGISDLVYQGWPNNVAQTTINNSNVIRVKLDNINDERRFSNNSYVTVLQYGRMHVKNYRKIIDIEDAGNGMWDITFDGEPIDIISGVSWIYPIAQDAGSTDSVRGHVGMSNVFDGIDGHEGVKFLHIENLWGNVWQMVDGYWLDNYRPLIAYNMADYTSDIVQARQTYYHNFTKVYKQSDNSQQPLGTEPFIYIRELQLDPNKPDIMIPSNGGASHEAPFGDTFYSYDGELILVVGGGIDHIYRGGLFTQRNRYKIDETGEIHTLLYGSRLIYRPVKEV